MAIIKNSYLASEYSSQFDRLVRCTDTKYSKSLARLQLFHNARDRHNRRQKKRLEGLLSAEDVRVHNVAERIAREAELKKYLEVMREDYSIENAVIDNTYVLKGKIRDDATLGLAGRTVQLVDSRNRPVIEGVKTDAEGNYEITLDMEDSTDLKKMRLRVLDEKGTQLYKDPRPVVFRNNQLDTRDLLIAKINKVDRVGVPPVDSVRPIQPIKPIKPILKRENVLIEPATGLVKEKIKKRGAKKAVNKKTKKKIVTKKADGSKNPRKKITKKKTSISGKVVKKKPRKK